MRIWYWSVAAVALILSSLCESAIDFLTETSVRSWSEQFRQLSSEDQQMWGSLIRSTVSETAVDEIQLNLLGLLAFSEGDSPTALVFFQRACELSNYTTDTMIYNWLITQHAIGINPIPALSDLIPMYPESRVLPQALANEFTVDDSEDTYFLIYDVLRRFPTVYGLWALFASMHLRHNFISGGRSPNAGVEFTEEAALVKYGLSMFPRSPELLLLRAIHAITAGDIACAAYYSDMTKRHRHLEYGVMSPSHFDQLANVVASSGATLDYDHASHSCLPNAEHLSAVSYRATYDMIQQAASENWSRVLNISSAAPNSVSELVPSSIRDVPALGDNTATWHLPSLQIGCNRVDICAHPGFFVADAVLAASTHFLTQAHDLHMVDDASVGLVYSSHTLEHLSHNLPPQSCASYPRPDASVRGCDSEVGTALTEWRRVLAPGGRLLVSVPDVAILAGAMVHQLATAEDKWNWMRYMFGGQSDPYDFHKIGFYYELLEELLVKRGFCEVTRVPRFSIFPDASWTTAHLSLSVHAVAC